MKTSDFKLHKPLNHVAFIMDGNGRWAKDRNKPRTYGHKVAISKLMPLIEECNRLKIKAVSLFAFSTENWKRPKEEINLLFNYLETFFKKNQNKLVKNNVRIIISGDYSKLPKSTVKVIDKAISLTKDKKGMILNICLNYGGKDEIIHAINKILNKKIKHINEKEFSKYLYSYLAGPIDLLIRTSGETRISNFMLYSLAYSEMIFTKTKFPDFDIKCFHKCLREYETRDRRYGGINK